MAEQLINCSVSSCFYNAAGNKCAASEIMVRNDPEVAKGAGRYEVGTIGGETNQALTSSQTACETFVPSSAGPKAGISRLRNV